MTTKRCFKCQCEKPLDAFYKHSRMGDGHLNKCKECTKNDVSKHRQGNLERIRFYDRMRGAMPHRLAARREYSKTPAGKSSHKRALLLSKQKSPGKAKARFAVSNALRNGRLTKLPCLVCGAEKVEGHHPDYSRPLDVVWLCQSHHKQAHAIAANRPTINRAA